MHLFTSFLLTSLVIPTTSASCIHGTTYYRRSLHKRADTKAFGYNSRLSPVNWGNLAPENAPCALSKVQSPINLDSSISFASEIPLINITIAKHAKLFNLGVGVEVEFEGEEKGGITVFNGQTFRFVQFHFHTPGEHRIGDEYFPVEMHMVHENINNSKSFAVLASMFQLSNDEGVAFMDTIVAKLCNITTTGASTTIGPIDLTPAMQPFANNRSYTYAGSLTTPPCTEGVTWLIPNQPLPITVDQFNALKSIIKFNSRYTQNMPGDVNLIQVATGNDMNVEATAERVAVLVKEEGQVYAASPDGLGAFGGEVGSIPAAAAPTACGTTTCIN